MPDVLLAPGSIKSLTDCKIGAGGVKDVIEIDIGVGGQVYKVWPSIEPYEDGTDLLKIGGIRYDGYIDDATGTAGSTSTSWGGSFSQSKYGSSNQGNLRYAWDTIFWYSYPDINVAQIDYLYCNYFYATKGRRDTTALGKGDYYCTVGTDPAGNPMMDTTHRVMRSNIATSTQYSFFWGIDMRNVNSGILKLGFHGTYGVLGGTSSGDNDPSASYSRVYLKHLYAQSEEPHYSGYQTFYLDTMT